MQIILNANTRRANLEQPKFALMINLLCDVATKTTS